MPEIGFVPPTFKPLQGATACSGFYLAPGFCDTGIGHGGPITGGASLELPKTIKCTVCGQRKGLSHFRKRSGRKGRHYRQCRRCEYDRKTFRRYGCSLDDRQKMAAEQNGRCVICQRKFDDKLIMCVDHSCLASGRPYVRGILCNNCNTFLGLAKDDVVRLLNAVKYLYFRHRRRGARLRRRARRRLEQLVQELAEEDKSS